MLALKDLLIAAGVLLLAAAFALTLYDLWKAFEICRRRTSVAEGTPQPRPDPDPVRWRSSVALILLACLPLVLAESIVVIPAGMGGVRLSQMRGTLPGTLYSGAHFVTPLVETVQLFDLRDKLFTAGTALQTTAPSTQKAALQDQTLDVQSREGLNIGLAITVRYRLDPHRLDYIETHLPQPVDAQMVPATVASAWRDLAPEYTVREISVLNARKSAVEPPP
jgi:regulator of protease activity HflC (stomatin/prohibitin superfamily)